MVTCQHNTYTIYSIYKINFLQNKDFHFTLILLPINFKACSWFSWLFLIKKKKNKYTLSNVCKNLYTSKGLYYTNVQLLGALKKILNAISNKITFTSLSALEISLNNQVTT